MSQQAELIEALQLYRLAQGTPDEQAAFDYLNETVQRVREGQGRECCGGRCRFCPMWRGK